MANKNTFLWQHLENSSVLLLNSVWMSTNIADKHRHMVRLFCGFPMIYCYHNHGLSSPTCLDNSIKFMHSQSWAISWIRIQLLHLYMPYFEHHGHSWNEATRQLSELLLHLRSRGHSEPLHWVQAKPYKAFNTAPLQIYFGHTIFHS